MKNKEKILTRKEIRALGGFKPGYPVARGEGMICTADFERVAMNCFNAGVRLERTFGSYDYNYMGKMYRWTKQA